MSHWLLWISCAIGVTAAPAAGPQVIPPASVRFAVDDAPGVPDFQRHVVPLLGRLGCNTRSCHGSFQGRGGFRLSLFGSDFGADHAALLAAGEGRVDREDPEFSLILQKPTLLIPHKGGRRLEEESWAHRLLLRWIEAGALGLDGNERRLEALEVTPEPIVLAAPGDAAALRVIARWADGGREDVTCLGRFQSNDESVAAVDAAGRVTAVGPGDTHVVVFYDSGVAAIPVLIPVTNRVGPAYPEVPTPTRIDALVVNKLRTLGIVPSEVCTDAEFLRRVRLDLTGTLPAPAEVEAFLADRSADKRGRTIRALLETPEYAAWWTTRLCDFTGNAAGSHAELAERSALEWYEWLYRRVRDNTPYDELVAAILLATGREPGQSYEAYAAARGAIVRDSDPAAFARLPTLPHYWTRRTLERPQEKALAVAHSFLGVRLQCAECHRHPFDRWTRADFDQFAAFFRDVTFGVAPESRAAYRGMAAALGLKADEGRGTAITPELLARAQDGDPVPWRELYVAHPEAEAGSGSGEGAPRRLTLLGDEVVIKKGDDDPRRAVLDWMVRPENPYFARALVNRVWANYFHTGLVDPPDDLNAANPPVNPALLDDLAARFVASGYDLKWLHHEIVSSATYQRSWRPNATNRGDARNFSRAIPRRLPAEVLYDALKQATAADAELERVRTDRSRRAIGHLASRMSGTYAMDIFGKPERKTNCDCERSGEPSLLQAVFLQNDPLVHVRLDESGWLREALQGGDVAAGAGDSAEVPDLDRLIRAAYLRTVSRPPAAAERARARRHLDEAESLARGLRELLWALLNTKEFVLNH
jgi:hypothetical protein